MKLPSKYRNIKIEFCGGPKDGLILYKKINDIKKNFYHTDYEEDLDVPYSAPLYHYYLVGADLNNFKYNYQGIIKNK